MPVQSVADPCYFDIYLNTPFYLPCRTYGQTTNVNLIYSFVTLLK